MVISSPRFQKNSGASSVALLSTFDPENIYRNDGHIVKCGAELGSGIDGSEFVVMHSAKTDDPFKTGSYHAYRRHPDPWRCSDQFFRLCGNSERL